MINLGALRSKYSAVILGYGATSDRELGIKNECSEGVISARNFVNWYNGHPEYSQKSPMKFSSVKNVVIIGQGNVAIDCARILTKSIPALECTDISTTALQDLAQSRIENVTIVGRRGHAQSSFTIKELRELTKLEGVAVNILREEVQAGSTSSTLQELEGLQNRSKKRIVELIDSIVDRNEGNSERKSITFRFLLTPKEVISTSLDGKGCVKGLRVVRNKLIGPPHEQRAVEVEDAVEEILPCDLLISSVGYRCEPLRCAQALRSADPSSSSPHDPFPFDARSGTVPSRHGRVLRASRGSGMEREREETVKGLYVVGWLKRGPKGIIGTNINDAKETVESLLQDLESMHLPGFHDDEYEPFPLAIRSDVAGKMWVTWSEYLRIEEEERRRGQAADPPRDKVKLLTLQEMMAVAKQS